MRDSTRPETAPIDCAPDVRCALCEKPGQLLCERCEDREYNRIREGAMRAPRFKVGDRVHSEYQRVYGIVQKIEWSVSFGSVTYLVTHGDRDIWVCQGDLKPSP